MGSSPTFDPSVLAKPEISTADGERSSAIRTTRSSTGAPAFNRAIAAGYPTGSTFKPITALAALDADRLTPTEIINDDGLYKLGDAARSATPAMRSTARSHLREALQVSSDVFFYTLGGRLQENIDDDGDEFIQDWAKSLGFGDVTGIDVPGEAIGPRSDARVAERALRERRHRPPLVGRRQRQPLGRPGRPAGRSAPAGGRLRGARQRRDRRDPARGPSHRGSGRQGGAGDRAAPGREVEIDDAWREPIMDGLDAAAMEPGGTSYPVFGSFPVDIAGKTGTAETIVDGVERPGAGTRRSCPRTIPRSRSSTRSRRAASASTPPRRPQARS